MIMICMFNEIVITLYAYVIKKKVQPLPGSVWW